MGDEDGWKGKADILEEGNGPGDVRLSLFIG
jgi:hypothetical protein